MEGLSCSLSLPALRLLDAEQLQALVAHEIAYEYWWDAWETARQRSDRVELRSLETRCDAVAALTLTALGIPAERFISALGAVHDFNRSRFGIPVNDANYPTIRERREIVKRFSAADGSRGQRAHAASRDPSPRNERHRCGGSP